MSVMGNDWGIEGMLVRLGKVAPLAMIEEMGLPLLTVTLNEPNRLPR
jgi:hypothetical protein